MAREKEHYHDDIFTRITRKVEFFIEKHIKIIVIVICICVVSISGYFGVKYFISRKEEQANQAFGKVYMVYKDVKENQDIEEEEYQNKLDVLLEDFKIILEKHPQSRAATRSAFFMGNIFYEKGNYSEALKYYQMGSSVKKKFYISYLCLMGKAKCYEQLENYSQAVETYKYILKTYKDTYIIPSVLFSLGQIYERLGKYELSEDEYSRIVSDYQWSGWKDFSDKKLILIKSFIR